MKVSNLTITNNNIQYPVIPNNISLIVKSKRGTKDFYNILNQNDDIPTSKKKWESIYDLDHSTWTEICMSPFRSTNSTALQWLQLRINHNILPTKKYLFKIKVREDPYCAICDEEEDIVHMLWSCPETQTFLQQVQSYLSANDICCRYNEKSFIFNIGSVSTGELEFNLKLKQYIFSTKFHNKCLSHVAAINKIKSHYEPLKYLAQKNKNKESFLKQWKKYNNMLENK